MENNLSDDMKNVMIQSDICYNNEHLNRQKPTQYSMSKSMYDKPSPDVAVVNISDYMKIPNLWNKIERVEDEKERDIDDIIDDITKEWELI